MNKTTIKRNILPLSKIQNIQRIYFLKDKEFYCIKYSLFVINYDLLFVSNIMQIISDLSLCFYFEIFFNFLIPYF